MTSDTPPEERVLVEVSSADVAAAHDAGFTVSEALHLAATTEWSGEIMEEVCVRGE